MSKQPAILLQANSKRRCKLLLSVCLLLGVSKGRCSHTSSLLRESFLYLLVIEMASKTGVCRICGEQAALTFEHIPPRSCFNEYPMVELEFERLIKGVDYDSLKGPINQRGSGGYYCCARCNNYAGRWFVGAYRRWVVQSFTLLDRIGAAPTLTHRYYLCPLNVFKQVIYMLVALNPPEFSERFPAVRRYLLNHRSRDWDQRLRIWMSYNVSGYARFAGGVGFYKLLEGTSHIISELGYPPFTFVMTHDCSLPAESPLCEITFFNGFLYNELSDIWLSLPVVNPYTAYPGDYRTKETVIIEAKKKQSADKLILLR